MGHRTEGLEKFARDVPEDRCFSIIFKDQRSPLDLIASSPADMQHWVQGLRKIIQHSGSMDQRQKLQQYPLVTMGPGPAHGHWLWSSLGQPGYGRYPAPASPPKQCRTLLKVLRVLKQQNLIFP